MTRNCHMWLYSIILFFQIIISVNVSIVSGVCVIVNVSNNLWKLEWSCITICRYRRLACVRHQICLQFVLSVQHSRHLSRHKHWHVDIDNNLWKLKWLNTNTCITIAWLSDTGTSQSHTSDTPSICSIGATYIYTWILLRSLCSLFFWQL